MANITIKMKSGEVKEFLHEGRAGGSYTKTIRYEGMFAIIMDEDGKQTAIPATDIETIEVSPHRWS